MRNLRCGEKEDGSVWQNSVIYGVVIFLTYEETVDYILNIPKFTKKNEPDHTREFLRRLSDPQERFPVVHVAGSNGKGSVCAFLNSVLMKSGVHVGLFTSPHLVDIRERFLLDGKPCSKEQFLAAEQVVHETVDRMREDGLAHPTFFEYIFAIGMVLFSREEVACAILETGLGGRLDATNVVRHPLLTIITSISLEHTEILGDTIAAIAGEKAGIIKPGVPVIFDGSEPEASAVIAGVAAGQHAPMEEILPDNIKILLNDGKSIDFSLESGYDVNKVRIPFPAEYQTRNGALALAAANRLKAVLPITDQGIREGFRTARWPGRMEEIEADVYLDGAHNVSGVKAFLEAVKHVTKGPSILLFSMVKEKNYSEAIRLLREEGDWDEIILTKISDNQRALETAELLRCFQEESCGAMTEAAPGQLFYTDKKECRLLTIEEPEQAYARALADRKPGQKLFCTGSLYLVGELKKITGGSRDD